MRLTCRVLPYEAADGPANMAYDEALLDAVAAGGGDRVPALPMAGRCRRSVSVYFQRLAEVQADPRWQSAALVRRLTGGGAIWHHYEVTYALVVPAGHARCVPTRPFIKPCTRRSGRHWRMWASRSPGVVK